MYSFNLSKTLQKKLIKLQKRNKGRYLILKNKTSKDINFEICRENSEGLYAGEGHIDNEGTEDEVGYQIMKCSYKSVKRLAEFAVERAKARSSEKATVHLVFKTNVLKYAAVPWQRVFNEMKNMPEINAKYMHIDNFLMQMLLKPEQFNVVITENMFGDIATDAGAVIQGGIGSAVSGNINPTGNFPSMYEPIHGSAPDKWYEMDEHGEYIKDSFVEEKTQEIKPEAAFLSYSLMLEQLGELKAAEALKEAALNNIRNPKYKEMKLNELIDEAIKNIKEKEL